MAKVTLDDITSGYASIAKLNNNFALLAAAIENTLALDGTTPNSLLANLDLNSNDILNVDRIATTSMLLGGTLVELSALNVAYNIVDTATETQLWISDNGISVGSEEDSITINGVSHMVKLGVHTEGAADIGGITEHRHSEDAALGPHVILARSRGTEASETVVQDGDVLSRIVTVAHDGTDFNVAAEIRTEVDGTPGTDDMPTKVVIATTPDGANVPIDRMTIDQAGLVTASVNNVGGRNVIVDGNMQVWQEADVTGITSSIARDMVKIGMSASGTVSLTKQDNGDGTYGHKLEVTTSDATVNATDTLQMSWRVEGYDYKDLYLQDQVLSLKVRSNKAGTYCVGFRNGATDRTYMAEFTMVGDGSLETISIPIDSAPVGGTWDFTNGVGLHITIALVNGSGTHTTPGAWQTGDFISTANQVNLADTVGNYFQVDGIKLEGGLIATPNYREPYADVLARVLRYLKVRTKLSVGEALYNLSVYTTVLSYAAIPFEVEMRGAPSCSVSAGTDFDVQTGGSAKAASAISFTQISPSGVRLSPTHAAGTVGDSGWLQFNSDAVTGNQFIKFDARL